MQWEDDERFPGFVEIDRMSRNDLVKLAHDYIEKMDREDLCALVQEMRTIYWELEEEITMD